MLLKTLADHARHRPDLPPAYYRQRFVRWAIQLDSGGHLVGEGLVSLADEAHPTGSSMPAPYIYRAGITPPPTLLADTLQYACAMPKDDSDKEEAEALRRNAAYVQLLQRWRAGAVGDPRAQAVCAFFEAGGHFALSVPAEAKPSDLLAIRVVGDDIPYVHLADSAVECWQDIVKERKGSGEGEGICLSCGRTGTLLATLPEPIKSGAIPVASGRGRDAQLVSINKAAQGRGGVIQLVNTPICDRCGQSVSVLNSLLADREHRYRGRDAVTVWWLREPQEIPLLRSLDAAEPADVQAIYEAARKAAETADIDANAFYALTLSANQSRAVVRDWIDTPLPKVLGNVREWFNDHRVFDPWKNENRTLPLWQLAQSCGRWDRTAKRYVDQSAPKTIEQDLIKTALTGEPPPVRLLTHLLQRVRADARVDPPRIALLQLLLARSVPKENSVTDVATTWGRVFAVLESIQRRAIPDVNSSLRDRYFRIAMTRPRPAFVQLRSNANGHLRKLQRSKNDKDKGAGFALEARLKELIALLPAEGPPAHLDLPAQARFICGYDRQGAEDITAARRHGSGSAPESDSDS